MARGPSPARRIVLHASLRRAAFFFADGWNGTSSVGGGGGSGRICRRPCGRPAADGQPIAASGGGTAAVASTGSVRLGPRRIQRHRRRGRGWNGTGYGIGSGRICRRPCGRGALHIHEAPAMRPGGPSGTSMLPMRCPRALRGVDGGVLLEHLEDPMYLHGQLIFADLTRLAIQIAPGLRCRGEELPHTLRRCSRGGGGRE